MSPLVSTWRVRMEKTTSSGLAQEAWIGVNRVHSRARSNNPEPLTWPSVLFQVGLGHTNRLTTSPGPPEQIFTPPGRRPQPPPTVSGDCRSARAGHPGPAHHLGLGHIQRGDPLDYLGLVGVDPHRPRLPSPVVGRPPAGAAGKGESDPRARSTRNGP